MIMSKKHTGGAGKDPDFRKDSVTEDTEETVQDAGARGEEACETGPCAAETGEAAADPAAALQAELAACQDKLLRCQADYQNYRKRMARDIADARKVGVIDTLSSFLTIFDQLDMARTAAERSDNVDALRQGLEMIGNTFAKELENLGVTRFSARGEKFDPALHEAVAQQPDDQVPEGTVSAEWSCGYRLGDRLLRPARVVVSSGPARETGDGGEKPEQ